jgi:hypothetical protein
MEIEHTEETEYIDTINTAIVVVSHKKVTTNNNNVYEVKVVKSIHNKFIEGRYYGIENKELTFVKLFGPEDSTFVLKLYQNPINYDNADNPRQP